MKFKAYPKIKQFRNVVRDISYRANYKGKDKNGKPIYEDSIKPILKFRGTVKLHGTNAMVYFTPENGVMAGKRSSALPKDALSSHMGFNQFVHVTKKDYFVELLSSLYGSYCNENEQIILYGEWAGKGIQKGVAISELPKSFYIFDYRVYNLNTGKSKWLDITLNSEPNVYEITEFPIYEIEIDFNKPGFAQNELIEFTKSVESECPVAKQLGVSGIGEGIVWKTEWKGERYIFKVKGEKHSPTKVKKLANVDPEVLNSIQSFVDYACTGNRIEQAIMETNSKERKDMPILLRWMANDIIVEENDVLLENKLEWKQVSRSCADRIRQYFFSKLDKDLKNG